MKRVIVSLNWGDTQQEVGELVGQGTNIFFRYRDSFLGSGLLISPIHLPLGGGTHRAQTTAFDGLFGVFGDSLPDGWGRLLLDRVLQERGRLGDIDTLDRLCYVGDRGMGALSYRPANDYPSRPQLDQIQLDQLAAASQSILSEGTSDTIDDLLVAAASSGGARPKIVVGYNEATEQLMPYAPAMPSGFDAWMIKFPALNDPADIAQAEYAYHLMAVDAGIEMSACRLFTGRSGRKYFGTRRFDRIGNQRLHLHSASGLLHDNFRLSQMDYGHLMDAAFQLEKQMSAYHKVLRLAAFNVFAHNRDDHSKNFSFLMSSDGTWRMAPAYDLTFSQTAHGQHSTTVAKEGKHPTAAHLLELARTFQVPDARTLIDQVKTVVSDWPTYAARTGVGRVSAQRIQKNIQSML